MSIELNNASFVYMRGTPYEKTAIKNITLSIEKGEFVGIIGHTGSGKSTLVQHLNGLIKPSQGTVLVDGIAPYDSSPEAKMARRKVGMVFQYPEQQLFEETVYDDIAFGPKNLGLTQEEAEERVRRAMDFVGLDFNQFAQRSPFRLSGGQMRRVAIAGVIAIEPEYLVLDEPSAGLDPRGREEIFGQVSRLYQSTGITVVLVSHNMEDVARLAGRVLVMHEGTILLDGKTADIFKSSSELLQAGVDVPHITSLLRRLKGSGLEVDESIVEIEQAAKQIFLCLGKGR